MKAIDIYLFLKHNGYRAYGTQESIIPLLVSEFKSEKKTVIKELNELKKQGLLVRKFSSGYCQTTCSSCYEYGCDAGARPPISIWVIS